MPPPAFGERGGPALRNRGTLLADIDRALGVDGPPAIEYLYARPFTRVPLPYGWGFNLNAYGHSAVR